MREKGNFFADFASKQTEAFLERRDGMKRFTVLLWMSVLLFGLTGCARDAEERVSEQPPTVTAPESEPVTSTPEIQPFSYEEVRTRFGENDPGVKTAGFQNVTQVPVVGEADAIERAKTECTVEYNWVRVRYDSAADVWEICFLPNHPGGGQDVYLNSDGVTQLIVYGE